MNIPLRAHTPAAEHRRMFDEALAEINARFDPNFIIISAGFDSRISDPLGQLMLEDEDFAAMTRTVKELARKACAGRLISCLEGGYNIGALGQAVRAHVQALSEG